MNIFNDFVLTKYIPVNITDNEKKFYHKLSLSYPDIYFPLNPYEKFDIVLIKDDKIVVIEYKFREKYSMEQLNNKVFIDYDKWEYLYKLGKKYRVTVKLITETNDNNYIPSLIYSVNNTSNFPKLKRSFPMQNNNTDKTRKKKDIVSFSF